MEGQYHHCDTGRLQPKVRIILSYSKSRVECYLKIKQKAHGQENWEKQWWLLYANSVKDFPDCRGSKYNIGAHHLGSLF